MQTPQQVEARREELGFFSKHLGTSLVLDSTSLESDCNAHLFFFFFRHYTTQMKHTPRA